MDLTPQTPQPETNAAIDTADTAASSATDQRGVPRPVGVAPDIGAFERTAGNRTECVIHALVFTSGQSRPGVEGPPSPACRVQVSADLLPWSDVWMNPAGGGWFWMEDGASPAAAVQFYRLVWP